MACSRPLPPSVPIVQLSNNRDVTKVLLLKFLDNDEPGVLEAYLEAIGYLLSAVCLPICQLLPSDQ